MRWGHAPRRPRSARLARGSAARSLRGRDAGAAGRWSPCPNPTAASPTGSACAGGSWRGVRRPCRTTSFWNSCCSAPCRAATSSRWPKRLLRTFGDLNRVMAAPPAHLAEIDGGGPAVVEQLKIMETLGHRMAWARVIGQPVLASWTALRDYLRTALSHQETERFRVLYLDRRNVLIAGEELAEGTLDREPVYPREVMRRALALALNASALIVVHNHRSGDPDAVRGRRGDDAGHRAPRSHRRRQVGGGVVPLGWAPRKGLRPRAFRAPPEYFSQEEAANRPRRGCSAPSSGRDARRRRS